MREKSGVQVLWSWSREVEHYIQLRSPGLVVDAIRTVIEETRASD